MIKEPLPRKRVPVFSILLAQRWAYFHVPVCQNEREPEGNSRGDARSKHTKIVVLCDLDGERGTNAKQTAGGDFGNESAPHLIIRLLSIVSACRTSRDACVKKSHCYAQMLTIA